jgi:hypothetical protein
VKGPFGPPGALGAFDAFGAAVVGGAVFPAATGAIGTGIVI